MQNPRIPSWIKFLVSLFQAILTFCYIFGTATLYPILARTIPTIELYIIAGLVGALVGTGFVVAGWILTH